MEQKTRIGFIGFGSMGQAIAQGLLTSGACAPQQITACAAHFDRLKERASALKIRPAETPLETAQASDLVVLAVKPHQIEAVTAPILDVLAQKTVISIAAGWTFEQYEALFRPGTHHLSSIPNTPVSVCEGIFVCEERHSLSQEELSVFRRLFGSIALIEMVGSAQFSIAGTISGCAPAYTAMYLEALGDAAVKHGLPRQTAYRLAAKMICGTGKLYLEGGMHPGAMKDAVCSPGGTTIRGVAALERSAFRGAVIDAIDAAEQG